ncbi:MAG: hypothetical protein AAB421_03535 [Patescibacteria group bacterium]
MNLNQNEVDEISITEQMVPATYRRVGSSYGFATVFGLDKDIFVHITNLPKDGERVIWPKNGGRIKVRYGKRRANPAQLAAVEVEVIDRKEIKEKVAA